jgi:tetratricopeptide (TPR) repeat protein
VSEADSHLVCFWQRDRLPPSVKTRLSRLAIKINALETTDTAQVTVINLLLRSYLANNQYDQADKLISKSSFQGQVNQAQSVRWLFYAGRLKAIQLNYSKAREYFQTAIRRAPKDELAPGFVQIVSMVRSGMSYLLTLRRSTNTT